MIKVAKLKNAQGEQIYPITHARAVLSDDGSSTLFEDVVTYSEQTGFTEELKAQARENIGLGSVDEEPTIGSDNLVKSNGVASVNGYREENSEFIRVYTDENDKILEATKLDGTKTFTSDVNVDGDLHVGKDLNLKEISTITGIDHKEFIAIWVDKNEKIIFGIQKDGNVLFGNGIPKQILNHIQNEINKLSPDGYGNIVSFINNLLYGTSTLDELLDSKVTVIDGKDLIDSEFADAQDSIHNDEYLQITSDQNDKIIEGIKVDGSKVINSEIEINNSIKTPVADIQYVKSPEYIKAEIDGDNKIVNAIRKDGSVILGGIDCSNLNEDVINSLSSIHSDEYMLIETDSDGKLISGRKLDGTKFENVGIYTNNINIGGISTTTVNDCEDRINMIIDNDGKIVSYRKLNGELVESSIYTEKINISKNGINQLYNDIKSNSNIDTEYIYKSPNLPKYGTTNIISETFYLTADENVSNINDVVCILDVEDTDANAVDRLTICHYYVKNTLGPNNTILPTSIKLQHYASGKVKKNDLDNKYYATDTIRKVNNVWYYADTLGYAANVRNKVIDSYSRIYTGTVPESGNTASVNTEVVEINGPANVNTWTVEDWDYNAEDGTDIGTKYEHKCICDIDFGHYFTASNITVGVKHQGNSTQGRRKRNYRYTLYNNKGKKDKIKIGEMLRLSKFNLKANANDDTRIKELVLYRIFFEIWQNRRPIVDRYNWDGGANGYYHGVSGNIEGFPIRLNVNGDFYGIYVFTLPKDGKNYLIDDEDDSTGLLVSGAHNTTNDWGVTLPYNIYDHYDSEMDEDLSSYPSIINSLTEWTHFINNRLYKGSDNNTYNSTELTEIDGDMYVTSTLVDGAATEDSVTAELIKFNRLNIIDRLDVIGFIDYFICMQVFILIDSGHNNVILYSGPDKKKMFPFFYDVDAALSSSRGGYACDILAEGVSNSKDLSLWNNLKSVYWDDIVNRYCELRNSVLSLSYIRRVYEDIAANIPSSDYINENLKWNANTNSSNFERLLELLKNRFEYLDNNYFIV